MATRFHLIRLQTLPQALNQPRTSSLALALVGASLACTTCVSPAPGPDPTRSREPAPSTRHPRQHIFLITSDALRADHLSHNGYPRPTSPSIDDLATQSWGFQNAITPIAKTRPRVCQSDERAPSRGAWGPPQRRPAPSLRPTVGGVATPRRLPDRRLREQPQPACEAGLRPRLPDVRDHPCERRNSSSRKLWSWLGDVAGSPRRRLCKKEGLSLRAVGVAASAIREEGGATAVAAQDTAP